MRYVTRGSPRICCCCCAESYCDESCLKRGLRAAPAKESIDCCLLMMSLRRLLRLSILLKACEAADWGWRREALDGAARNDWCGCVCCCCWRSCSKLSAI